MYALHVVRSDNPKIPVDSLLRLKHYLSSHYSKAKAREAILVFDEYDHAADVQSEQTELGTIVNIVPFKRPL